MARFSPSAALAQLLRTPLVPVYYHAEAACARRVLAACYAGGLRAFEFTNRGPVAPAVFAELRQFAAQQYPDLLLGAGTIYTAAEAEQFVAAGADFIVQPLASVEVAAVCQRHDLAWVPGAFTLTEIYQAHQQGAAMVKLFPASSLGPDYVKALRGPLPGVPLMATGGIAAEPAVLAAWFGAGVNCVGLGSQLFAEYDDAALTARLTALLAAVQVLRKPALTA